MYIIHIIPRFTAQYSTSPDLKSLGLHCFLLDTRTRKGSSMGWVREGAYCGTGSVFIMRTVSR